jgi:outer membrane protein insertion porin family
MFLIVILSITILNINWQENYAHSGTDLALERIEIYVSEVKIGNLENLTGRFRLKRLNAKNIETIHNEIVNRLHKSGYHLAAVDSHFVEPLSPGMTAVLHFYLSSGPLFLLQKVSWHITDTLHNSLHTDFDEIASRYVEQPFTGELQTSLFLEFVELLEKEGYPLCRIITRGFELDSLKGHKVGVDLKLEIDIGPLVKLAGLKLPPESDINPNYLKKSFAFEENEIYDEERVEKYQRILNRQDFIKSVDESNLVLGKDSLFYLKMNYEQGPSTSFDGIIGYIPPPVNEPDQEGFFSGLINLSVRNLFGTGRRLDVFWRKPNRLSEEFSIKYREPFIFGFPFHLGGSLSRLIRDTTYIEWEYAIRSEIPLNENLTGLARFYTRQVYPDSLASRQLRLPRTEAIHTELGIEWDTRDNFYNPRKGVFLNTLFDYGKQENVGPFYLLKEDSLVKESRVIKMQAQLALFFMIWKKQVLSFNLNGVFIGFDGQNVRIPDMFWFGGATTVRGYRENQFFAEKVGWLNTEYRFLFGDQSRIFVFHDIALYGRQVPEKKEQFLMGYGLGIRFPGPIGVLQVDYGLAEGLNFREGKIHFRLINEF